MKNFFFAVIFLIIGPQAWAQTPLPSCWPKQIRGAGGDAVHRETADAEGVAWRCGPVGATTDVRVCRLKLSAHWLPPMGGLTGIGAARGYWLANVSKTCRDPEFQEVDDLLRAALRE